MNRKRLCGFSAGVILIVLSFLGAVSWVLGTSAGAAWIMGKISSYTPVTIAAGKVEGKIWGGLRLGDLDVRWPDGELHADNFHVVWNPVGLLYGNLDIGRLAMQNVYLHDTRPETAGVPGVVWPRVTGLLSHTGANVRAFSIQGLTYRRLERNPVKLNSISGRIKWRRGILTVRDVSVSSPQGTAKGTLRAGFVMPSLSVDLALEPSKSAEGLDMISVVAGLEASRASGPLKGEIHITGSSRKTPRIEFGSGLEIDSREVRLGDFRITRIIRKGSVTGSGSVTFSEGGPRFYLNVKASRADFSPFLRRKTDLSATVLVEGNFEDYHGRLDLSNAGDSLTSFHLEGSLHGDGKGLEMTLPDGSWLGGAISGLVSAGWKEEVSLRASLQARDLDPSLISPEWTGRINADASGSALLVRNKPFSASLSASLLKSVLRDRTLTGEVKADLRGNNLKIDRLLLEGKGFNIMARGELSKRIGFAADIRDLSGLVPGAKGALHTAGWVVWRVGHLAGNVRGRAEKIEAGGFRIGTADFNAGVGEGGEYPLHMKTRVTGLLFRGIRIESAGLRATGNLADHVVELDVRSAGATVTAKFSGGYEGGKWTGKISDFSERDTAGALSLYAPSALVISKKEVSLSRLLLKGEDGEHLEAEGALGLSPLDGSLHAGWADMNLGRARYWLAGLEIAGRSSGKLDALWRGNALYRLYGKAEASGTFALDGQKLRVDHASLLLDRDENRFLVSFDVGMNGATVVKGNLSSSVKGGVFLPEEGAINAQLKDLDLSLFRRWVPEGVAVRGTVSGGVKGKLLPGMRVDIAGNVAVSGGSVSRRSGKGEVSASLRTAEAKFVWHARSLTGTLSLVLEDYGHAAGSFDIPLAAIFPPSMDRNGTVNVSLKGRFREKGILEALFPGLVQETHGRIDLGIGVGGTWKAPDFRGTMHLSDAGAYFPAGGIRIKDAGMSVRMEGDRVTVDSYHVSSGSGKIEGTAEMVLKDWTVVSYRGTLKGKDFQAIYLPELRIHASPDLAFEGSAKKLTVRGEIKIPYLLVLQSKTKTPVEPSRDVVIVDKEKKPAGETKTAVDIQVTIILGDRVLVKAEGVDARLGGSIDMVVRGVNDIRGKGQVHVIKGKYSTYGVSLDIVRGRVIYSGQQLSQPNLDILALRTSGDVKAGVTVTGTPRNPVVKLYSSPAMSDTDTLAYIVLGHPLSGGQQQADLVARAAGFLLSASDSVVFQDQLKHRLGIDTLDIESQPATAGTTGPPGSTPGGITRSLVTVGKYLTPSLYISYGRSLLGDTNLFRVRYSLSKHWELETESGTESGADIFYKINLK